MSESRAVAVHQPASHRPISVFESTASFEAAQRMAQALVKSDLVPEAYRGIEKMGNALIAMDMASRMKLSPMVVMQNMHIISGRPSWGSSFIISALNSCGLFSPLRFKVTKLGKRDVSYTEWEGPKGNRRAVQKKATIDDIEFIAHAVEKETGEVLEGPPVSYAMAVAEGWFFKRDSKWTTMGELMGRYRAAAFFGRLYAPHILNGMQTEDEVIEIADYQDVTPRAAPAIAAPVEPKPEGRPTGVHAALARGTEGGGQPAKATGRKGKTATPVEPEPEVEVEVETEAEIEDAEVEELHEDGGDDQHGADDDGSDNVPFGDADDDDYQPA